VGYIRILFIGDIVGKNARICLKNYLDLNKDKYDFVLANGENAVSGAGMTFAVLNELYSYGIDAISMGNHTFSKKEVLHFIDSEKNFLRPANYPAGVPGQGYTVLVRDGMSIGFISLMGRVYMNMITLDSPFGAADNAINLIKNGTKVIIVDFHAEATSEKGALAYYLDGRVTAVVGTHTHVQTADERILENGTAFISDVGMVGPYDGIIGVKKELIIDKFLLQMPISNELSNGATVLCAVSIDADEKTGKAKEIRRINLIFDDRGDPK
jgi:2',3'-cyclic-nucleotide 2'-phosphodiesterase